MTELPKGWATAQLSELVAPSGVFIDGDWVESKDQDPSGEIRLIQLADIGDGDFRDRSSRFLTHQRALELRCTFLKKDDLLIARMPDPLGRSCLFPFEQEEKFVTVVDVCILRPGTDDISARFLMYAINSLPVRKQIAGHQSGSTRKRISRGNLSTVTVPLAPLPEQHRIVARIEELFSELDASVENLTKARALLGLYRQSLLKAAFQGKLTAGWRAANPDKLAPPETLLSRIRRERERHYAKALQEWEIGAGTGTDGNQTRRPNRPRRPDPVNPISDEELSELPVMPSEWAFTRPSELASPGSYSIGIGPFGSNLKVSDYQAQGIPLVFVKNITRRDFGLDLKYVTATKAEELLAHSAEPNDILITKMGDPPGQCAIYPNEAPVAIITADCLKFRVWDEFFDRRFVAYVIESTPVQKQLGLLVRGVAQKKISVERFKTIVMPVPSLVEQVEIANRLDASLSVVEVMVCEITTALTRIAALRQSILKRAFSGRLVPQDPDDEPASALLARLQSQPATTPARRRRRA